MTDTTPGPASAASRSVPDPTPLGRYGDAFTADEPDRCWRYVTHDGFRLSPNRCPHPVNWAGFYDTRDRSRHRVWSCDGHLDGGYTWIQRPPAGRGPDPAERRSCRGDAYGAAVWRRHGSRSRDGCGSW